MPRLGFEADLGYFPQDHRSCLDPTGTVMSSLWDAQPDASIGFVHGKLAEVLFSRDDVDKKVENLSGGETARLLFSRISVQKPTVHVLDEPTTGLDPASRRRVMDLILETRREFGLTALIVSHDVALAESVDRVVVLENGLRMLAPMNSHHFMMMGFNPSIGWTRKTRKGFV